MDYRDIDLGLSIHWADRNIGSTTPQDPGRHYSWGDNMPWRSEGSYYAVFNNMPDNICGNAQFDTASIETGGKFRMPTPGEIKELVEKCNWTWIAAGPDDMLSGYDICGPNGNHIFLPAAGSGSGSVDGETFVDDYDIYGFYWSGQNCTDNRMAHCLFFKSDTTITLDSEWCSRGLSIRPVLNK